MTVTLPIQERTKTKSNGVDLKSQIPGIVYGPKQVATPVVVERKEFERVFKIAGESTIIELSGLATPVSVLVKDVSFAPTKGGIVHVDFYAIEQGREIATHVPLQFVGEAPAAKLGAVVNKVMHEVTVSCQPADLPAFIEVDLSSLAEPAARLTIADLVAPARVKITGVPEEVVAIAEVIVAEVEVVAEPVDMAAIPVEQKGKDETEA